MFVPDSPSAYKVYEQKNAIQKDHTLGSYFIDEEKYRELSGFKVEPNDIIVSCAGTIGETYIMPNDIREGIINQALMLIRLHLKDIQDFYLLYFDFILKAEAAKESKGTAIKNIPPLAEQGRILEEVNKMMSFVDSIDVSTKDISSLINSAKSKILDLAIHGKLVQQDANDEPASELLKRINPKAVASCDNPHYEQVGLDTPSNWLITSLSDICDNINGLWTGKKPPFVRVGVIRNANFTKDFRLDYSKIEYIEVEEKSFEKRHLLNGDIIVEKSGGSDKNPVGRAILYEGVDKQFSYSNFTMALRIRNHSCVYSKFLYYYLMAVYLRGDMRMLQTQTTGLHNLILDSYLSMPIYLPPFEEQKRISNKIDELFKSLEAIASTLK